MADRCPRGFDEALLSGYLDGELNQAVEQRVRVHLEDCAHCRALYAEIERLREATMTTRFDEPTDDQWDERPRTALSATARSLGWTLAVVWLAATAGYALWQLWLAPQNLAERLITFGGLSAIVLLFVSVLVDRLRSARTDRYREVER